MGLSRNEQLAIDHAEGATFSQLSSKYQIHASRCHQIYESVVSLHGLPKNVSANRLASVFAQIRQNVVSTDTPEGLYNQIERERIKDCNDMWSRLREAGYK